MANTLYNDGAGESYSSAVSWPAIFAGAVAALVTTLVLMLVGSGLGFAAMSPWSNEGASVTAISIGMIIFAVIVQWASSALGGYISGRLRTKWTNTHGDEVYFRDTAHGFLTWAVATILTAMFFACVTSSIVAGGAKAGTAVAAGAAAGEASKGHADTGASNRFVDTLLRSDKPSPNAPAAEVNAEVSSILANGIKEKEFPEADKNYLARVVAAKTSLSESEARARVDETIQKAKEAADTARKAAATAALITSISLILGALVAAMAAVVGGRCRDHVHGDMTMSRNNNV